MNNLVSIIMPCFNSAFFINEAVQSIIDQSYNEWELLIMDDCSTDNTLLIISAFEDNRISIYKSEINIGVAAQMNKGINVAKGDFICRMDSDDVSNPQRISEQLKFLNLNSDIGLCTTDYNLINNKGLPISDTYAGPCDYKAIRISLLSNLHICGASFFTRKAVLQNVNFDETLRLGEDYDLIAKIAMHYKISNIPKVLYHYRKYGNSVTDKIKNWNGVNLIRANYLHMNNIKLNQKQIDLFLDFVTVQYNYKIDQDFFVQIRLIKNALKQNVFFEAKHIDKFFLQNLYKYLISTKKYNCFVFKYVMFYYPLIFMNCSLKDIVRIFVRSF